MSGLHDGSQPYSYGSRWQDGPAYVEAFLMVLRNVTKEETVQYVLALLDEMLTGTNYM